MRLEQFPIPPDVQLVFMVSCVALGVALVAIIVALAAMMISEERRK